MATYLVTGASGQLGQLVVDHLASRVAEADIIALVRSDEAANAFAEKGIATRRGDYDDPASLADAFAGVDRLLLISSSEIGKRVSQHGNVIAAAKAAGVSFIAYTSLLGGAANPMLMAKEHIETERMLGESGMVHTILRNSWYIENFLMSVPQALETGQMIGAAGEGKFSAASRQDYAEAAAIVLAGGHDGDVLELGGDPAFTMTEFAEALTQITGTSVTYLSIPEEALKAGMIDSGLPEPIAAILADSDANASRGTLYTESRQLSEIIGRATTPYRQVLEAALTQGAA